ncbi:WD40/YVTN/BNR-like repeat-containing protein [Gorillibacterium sp. sgz500922]|uniref:WD40/YVTN/BNR-like repeat-containing protein n=1 Tax=Gorillibacterium sp. sgz500922 TaxID=3446694 RepID=UPI003F67C172
MYRTADGGKSWSDVSPNQGKLKLESSPVYGQSAFFLDADTGWFQVQTPDHKTYLTHTADSGASWRTDELPKLTFSLSLTFFDRLKGSWFTSSDAAMGSSEKTLFVTADGGRTWTKRTEAPLGTNQGVKTGKLPLGGHASYGIGYRDAQHGWAPYQVPDDKLHLYATADGGTTWKEQPLAAPAHTDGYPPQLLDAPVFFGKDRQTGYMPAVSRTESTLKYGGFFTADGGSHWQYRPFELGALSVQEEQKPPFFLDADKGWLLNRNTLYRTVDGGRTWKTLPKDELLAKQLASKPRLIRLQFATDSIGWMLLGDTGQKRSVLLKTTDGGAHWTAV